MARTILCVEDEEDTGNLIQAMLEREGYEVTRARDGRQAVLLIETTLPPALILLDVVIPYVNGFELLEALRHNPDWCHVPIVMLSADYYEPDIQRARREGATAYVVKKLGLQGLIEEVTRVLPAPAPPAPAPDQDTVMAAPIAPRKRRVSIRHQARGSTRKNRAA
ncbi:MAG: response regulator [Nitrospira sp.]|nr:response regulator [Nitrospira sp.]